ncbi:MAG: response regulator transcription factor [Lachnospiraceae bacterium]|nr:response regulator transcription factor [Lachnospiraceae bacterium]
MTDILIIEDNPELGALIRDFLKREGFQVEWRTSAEEGLAFLTRENCKLVLLDVMLPGINGYETCQAIREKKHIPILMMSARTDDQSKLLGYETGADDYIEKPFAIPILVAKIKALMRRSYEIQPERERLVYGGIELDYRARTVSKDGIALEINGKEFDVLYYLMKHTGEVVDKDKLFNAVWGTDCFSEPSTLNVHIRWLREKLEEDPKNPKYIQTVWKVGYKFGGGMHVSKAHI